MGRRPHRPVLRGAGEHPRLGRDRRRARRHLRGDGAARRSPSGCSTASPRRRPRAATGAGSSPRRCSSSSATAATARSPTTSSTCASTTTSVRSRSCGASTGCTRRSSARRRRDDWLAGRGRARAPSFASAAGSARRRAPSARRLGREREPRGARRRRGADRPGRARRARRRRRELRTSRPIASSRASRSASTGSSWQPDPQPLRHRGVRRQRLHGRRGGRRGRRGAHRGELRPRGGLRRRRRSRDVHARRRGGRRARRNDRPPARSEGAARPRSRWSPETTVLAVGAKAARRSRRRGGRWMFRAMSCSRAGRGSAAESRSATAPSRRCRDALQPRLLAGAARATTHAALAQLRRASSSTRQRLEVSRAERRDFASIRDDRTLSDHPGSGPRPRARAAPAPDRPPAARRAAPRRSSRRSSERVDDEHCRPSASANALCACSPPNGTSSSGRRRAGEHVAVRDAAHRDVADERSPVRATGSRSPAGSSRRASGRRRMAEPRRRGGGQRGDQPAVRELARPVAEHPGRERAARRRVARAAAARRAAPSTIAASVR